MDRHDFEEAAIRAEFETGRREPTERAARTHVIVRVARMGLGALLCLAGVIMLVLPGPGLLVVAAGLVVLAEDIAWADRALRYVRKRTPGIPEDGRLPRSTMLVSVVLGVAGILASVWWFVFR